MPITLKRCPRCGQSPYEVMLDDYNDCLLGYEIECFGCGLHTRLCVTPEQAVTEWNGLMKGKYNDQNRICIV